MVVLGAWHLRFGAQKKQRRGLLLFIVGTIAWVYAWSAFLEWRFPSQATSSSESVQMWSVKPA